MTTRHERGASLIVHADFTKTLLSYVPYLLQDVLAVAHRESDISLITKAMAVADRRHSILHLLFLFASKREARHRGLADEIFDSVDAELGCGGRIASFALADPRVWGGWHVCIVGTALTSQRR